MKKPDCSGFFVFSGDAEFCSDRHDLFFLLGDELSNLLFVFVQEAVGLFFATVFVVLVDLLVFFKLFDFVDEVAAEVAERDFRVLTELLGQLDILLAALFGERGNADPDGLAVGGRIESEIGVADRLFGGRHHGFVPDLNGEGLDIEHAEVADLFQRHLLPVGFHLDPVE